jgi:hypothetical protein
VLEAAIERVTRALVTAADEVIQELVAERRAMREELDTLDAARTWCRLHEGTPNHRDERRAHRTAVDGMGGWLARDVANAMRAA